MTLKEKIKRDELIETITWFLDEYRDQVKTKHLTQIENIIEKHYGNQISKDWL
jgi:hypothetical protein